MDKKGLVDLICLKCGDQNCISMTLDNIESFHCSSCERPFDVQFVRDVVTNWDRVLSWINHAPNREENLVDGT